MYLALYRKYRPRTFDDVISQEHITTTLRNQVISGSTGHAYLFTGSRGTGKTTCAKIFAMAMNCLNPQNGSPCLECEQCKEILAGSATDIVEMDAASNRKLDEMRQVLDEVKYTPVSCRYRVYIVDEVHMLTPEAFNALLKTLEEPPAHVKFILATTELHKVPATIASRCQRFEFRRVNVEDSKKRLLEVAEKENISLDPTAAELIARLSDGGMRDALSILDRCVAAGNNITSQTVRDYAGVTDSSHLSGFSEMIAKGNTAGCIRMLGELYRGAKDISRIIDELMGHYRDLMLLKSAPNDKDLLSALPDDIPELERISEMYTLPEILRCLTLLQKCADGIAKVKERRTIAEMCLVKMCTGVNESEDSPPTRITTALPQTAPQFREMPEIPFTPDIPKIPTTPAEKARADMARDMIESAKRMADASAPKPPESESPELPEPPPFDDNYPIPTEDKLPEPSEPPAFADAPDDQTQKPNSDSSEAASENALPELKEITPEQWKEAIPKMGYVASGMLADSDVRLENGMLVITSANPLLLGSIKGDELISFEKTVCGALGYSAHIEIEERPASPEEITPVERFIAKAREMGVNIEEKE